MTAVFTVKFNIQLSQYDLKLKKVRNDKVQIGINEIINNLKLTKNK